MKKTFKILKISSWKMVNSITSNPVIPGIRKINGQVKAIERNNEIKI